MTRRSAEGGSHRSSIEDQIEQPVFIVGAPRSGTSLLYKALCLHPEAAYISNWVARFPRLERLGLLNRVAARFPERRRRAWFGDGSNAYVYGWRRPWSERLFPMPVEGEPVYRSAGIVDSDGLTDEQRRTLRGRLARIAGYSGGARFISKRIANNRRIPLIVQAFPDARFVEVMRDGRAVAHSLSRVDWWADSPVWWYGGTPRQWLSEGNDPWELIARTWVEELRMIEQGLRAVAPDRVLRLTYEGLVGDPMATLGEVSVFAGLGPSPTWEAALRTLRFPNRNDQWLARLEPEVVRKITAIQSEELAARGYPT